MPNPYSIIIFPNFKDAIENDYYLKSYEYGQTIPFQLIIEDKQGNQIWLPYFIDEYTDPYTDINIKQILLTIIFFIIIKYTDYKKITHLFAISTYNISICKGTIFLSKRLSFFLLFFNVCMKNLLLHSLYSRITTFMDSFLPVSRGSFIYIT